MARVEGFRARGLFERADPLLALRRSRVTSTSVKRENNHYPAWRVVLALACGHEAVQVFKVPTGVGPRWNSGDEKARRAAYRLAENEEVPCMACGPAR